MPGDASDTPQYGVVRIRFQRQRVGEHIRAINRRYCALPQLCSLIESGAH